MPLPQQQLDEFKRLAQQDGSGIGIKMRQSGALGPLFEMLKSNTVNIQNIKNEITRLAGLNDATYKTKANKYKRAIYYLEIIIIPVGQRVSVGPSNNSKAIKFTKTDTTPTIKDARWESQKDKYYAVGTAQDLTYADAGTGAWQTGTVEDFILNNSATTRLYLVHVKGHVDAMEIKWDGRSAIDHIESVLYVGGKLNIPLCILAQPHIGGSAPAAAKDNVCANLQSIISQYPSAHITIADGGSSHTGYRDPNFKVWVEGATNTIVIMGYQGDMCVHGNVFGMLTFEEGERNVPSDSPPKLVGTVINQKDVVTSRALICPDGGTITKNEWGLLKNN